MAANFKILPPFFLEYTFKLSLTHLTYLFQRIHFADFNEITIHVNNTFFFKFFKNPDKAFFGKACHLS